LFLDLPEHKPARALNDDTEQRMPVTTRSQDQKTVEPDKKMKQRSPHDDEFEKDVSPKRSPHGKTSITRFKVNLVPRSLSLSGNFFNNLY
jgi:hypothetical protein